ncbi:MAG TPA: endo-1,4-beta-xylanase [Kofleriaceae bacterium]|jgi:endo-1,4-beta-xylanase
MWKPIVRILTLAVCALAIAPAAIAAPLRTSATAKGLFVGAAVNMTPFRNEPIYNDTLRREYNLLVAENAFKFDALHTARTTYNFTDADALVSFAQANGMAIRGHTLVWHNQLPGWLTGGTFTRDDVIAILRDHIMTVVGRYRGKILAWDVVNEAIDDSTGQLRTNSFWFQKIGPDYISMAFQFAHEADPNAILYYNDFEAEGSGTKSDGVFNLVSGLVNQGIPIGGVGWQMHKVNPFRLSSANHTNAQRIAGLGLEISITEMDVRIQLPDDDTKKQQQALAYGDAITFCLAEPNCAAVVSWGFTDKFSWVPGTFSGFGDALVFDANYQPKPAYTAMQSVLEGGTAPPPPPPVDVTITPRVAASGPWFNEQQIQIANTSTITALTVTITIQRTGGISFSGQYNTVGGSITQSNTTTSTAVTYQFSLTAGQTLGPSTNRIFAAQTSGTGTVHPTAGDTYTVTFTTGGQSVTKSGGF